MVLREGWRARLGDLCCSWEVFMSTTAARLRLRGMGLMIVAVARLEAVSLEEGAEKKGTHGVLSGKASERRKLTGQMHGADNSCSSIDHDTTARHLTIDNEAWSSKQPTQIIHLKSR